MGISISIKCDVCARVKQQTNHWYMAAYTPHGESVRLVILPIDTQEAQINSAFTILCGEECVHKYVSQNLALLHKT